MATVRTKKHVAMIVNPSPPPGQHRRFLGEWRECGRRTDSSVGVEEVKW